MVQREWPCKHPLFIISAVACRWFAILSKQNSWRGAGLHPVDWSNGDEKYWPKFHFNLFECFCIFFSTTKLFPTSWRHLKMAADDILTQRSESFWSEHMFVVVACVLEACRKNRPDVCQQLSGKQVKWVAKGGTSSLITPAWLSHRFELLHVLNFDSVRRRMSVIVRSSSG